MSTVVGGNLKEKCLGAPNALLRELVEEDPQSYYYHLGMDKC